MGTGFLSHFYMTHTIQKSGEEFFLLQTNLQVPWSLSRIFPLTSVIAGSRSKTDCHTGLFFSSYKISGIYSQKSVCNCVLNPIILSNLPIYYLVGNILKLLCKISPFHFSCSCANSMEQSYQHPPWYSSCMPHTADISEWLVGFLKAKHSYKCYHL